MSSTVSRILVMLVAAVAAHSGFAAFSPPPEEVVPSSPKAGDAANPLNPNRDAEAEAVLQRNIEQLRKLRAMMKQSLSLRDDQTKAVDQLFDGYLDALTQRKTKRPFGANPEDAERLRGLRARMQQANEAGDTEVQEKLRKEFRELLDSRRGSLPVTMSQFLYRVEGALENDQIADFRHLFKMLRIGMARGGAEATVRELWRVLQDPSINLEIDQRRAIQTILRDGITWAKQVDQDGSEGDVVVNQVRAAVFGQLTDVQTSRLTVLLSKIQATTPPPPAPDSPSAAPESPKTP